MKLAVNNLCRKKNNLSISVNYTRYNNDENLFKYPSNYSNSLKSNRVNKSEKNPNKYNTNFLNFQCIINKTWKKNLNNFRFVNKKGNFFKRELIFFLFYFSLIYLKWILLGCFNCLFVRKLLSFYFQYLKSSLKIIIFRCVRNVAFMFVVELVNRFY